MSFPPDSEQQCSAREKRVRSCLLNVQMQLYRGGLEGLSYPPWERQRGRNQRDACSQPGDVQLLLQGKLISRQIAMETALSRTTLLDV